MPLTQTFVVNAQPRAKTYRLFDGSGLCLEVTASPQRLTLFVAETALQPVEPKGSLASSADGLSGHMDILLPAP